MKKFLLTLVVTLGFGLLITSCKSKEERYLADYEDAVEQVEKAAENGKDLGEIKEIAEKAGKEMEEKYGEDWESDPEGVTLTDEQEEQIKKLDNRAEDALRKKAEEIMKSALD